MLALAAFGRQFGRQHILGKIKKARIIAHPSLFDLAYFVGRIVPYRPESVQFGAIGQVLK